MHKLMQSKKFALITIIYLTFLLMVFQGCVLLRHFDSLLTQSAVLEFLRVEVLFSPTIIKAMLFFLMSHLLLYATVVAFIYYATLAMTRNHYLMVSLIVWFWTMIFLFFANQVYFPQSQFSFFPKIFPILTEKIIFYIFLVLLIGEILFFLYLIKSIAQKSPRVINLFAIGLVSGVFLISRYEAIPLLETVNKPNVIIIGIDSLRPDYINADLTPHLYKFLKKATLYPNAITPLARTYPAWISLLTGDFPTTSQVRDDLSPIKIDKPLINQYLRAQGYTSLYAIDDSRFSPIDQNYGFDFAVLPPVGLNNFLFGDINDFPLSNLMMNTIVGKYLFPYNYMNRASFVTYSPPIFNKEIIKSIDKIKNSPVFIAVHFNLIHFPYIWSKSKVFPNLALSQTYLYYYQQAVKDVDKQVGIFFQALKERHLLDNAIIVILSDHGESLNLRSDKIVDEKNFQGNKPISEVMNSVLSSQGVGHGTDILTMTQNKILMAFRLTGQFRNVPGLRQDRVSLYDVVPTIFDYLRLPPFKTDGISLIKSLQNHDMIPSRSFYLETGLTPDSLKEGVPNVARVVNDAIAYHVWEPRTNRIAINSLLIPDILQSHQLAVLESPFLLVKHSKRLNYYVLINIDSGLWTTDMASNFAKQANVNQLIKKLNDQFKTTP